MDNSLFDFLENKTLYYDKIDYDIIYKSWDILKEFIELPYVIHIVGTNGKGTTGRFLSSFFKQLNKTVLHYSSPHVVKFNERVWINGSDSTDKQLNSAHKSIQKILNNSLLEKLTYFEYTTLLALYLSSKKDYLVLEAGLGGEFDATNVVKSDLSLFTTIDLDHQSFLGNSIEEIATTKMRSCNNAFILGKQINQDVYKVKNKILKEFEEIKYNDEIKIPKNADSLPSYLKDNLKLSLSVLEYLNLPITNLKIEKMPGRFEKISNNITIDVGHNPLAARVISDELKKSNQKIILVYNSYEDKDYISVLNILKPFIREVQIISCDDNRIVDNELLKKEIENLSLNVKDFDMLEMDGSNNYLVFGSFIVVDEFLSRYKEIKDGNKR
ncbi:MAG: bifunctional folylpolyglutamate synthase/dihydrofolate synthase [Campylobacterota bacterium]|nr:bifunctional folylpolyglutamate synthase/dihydrofolate synthase [Campylobacterota bacterium]